MAALIIVIIVCIIMGLIIHAYNKRQVLKANQLKQQMEQGALRYLRQIDETHRIPQITTPLNLKPDEFAILHQADSRMIGPKSYRVGVGGGTRVGKIYVGGWTSESNQSLRQLDTGDLYLTNRRLVFVGALKEQDIPWSHLMSYIQVNYSGQYALQVAANNSRIPHIYTVRNPLLWFTMLKLMNAAKITEPQLPSSANVTQLFAHALGVSAEVH